MPQHNDKLVGAKRRGDDEFYTPREMIEAELQHYPAALFKDKRILCNCDDPLKSHFFRYFADNFGKLKLRRVVGLRFDASALFGKLPPSRWQFPSDQNTPPYKQTLFTDKSGKRRITGMVDLPPGDTGGFDDREGMRQLKACDIVVTNPPFSRFRDFIGLLMARKKKFVIIGNISAMAYKDVFPLIHSGKIWLGAGRCKGNFERPRGGEAKAPSCWFTNLPHTQRDRPDIPLTAKYSAKDYPTCDNYAAIEVQKVKDIPADYHGEMGVPVTFLLKHNPRQFEVVGRDEDLLEKGGKGRFYVNGRRYPARIVIRRAGAGANWIEREDLDRNSIYGNAGGFVYVATKKGEKGYKIGKATNVATRLTRDAFSRNGPKAVMSLEVHNRHQAEKQVHDALALYRTKGAEWFDVPHKYLEEVLTDIAGKPIRLWQ